MAQDEADAFLYEYLDLIIMTDGRTEEWGVETLPLWEMEARGGGESAATGMSPKMSLYQMLPIST